MGEISMRGIAEREYEYDRIIINVSFLMDEIKAEDAKKKVMEQCEDFLNKLNDLGISHESIRFEKDEIDTVYERSTDEETFAMKRTISITTCVDMKLINTIMNIIAEGKYDIELDYNYGFSKANVIHEQLLMEAVADSRKKADAIAKAVGSKIIGIQKVHENNRYGRESSQVDFMEQEMYRGCSGYEASDEMKSPVSKESEDILIVWEIE